MNAAVEQDVWSGRGRLQNLVDELKRQQESKLDFVADSRELLVTVEGDRLHLTPRVKSQVSEFLPQYGLPIKPAALQQIGERQSPNVPWKFLHLLSDSKPETAAALLNDLLQDPARRFVRILDGRVRAFLSDSYRVMDHFDVAFAALDVVRQNQGEVLEASLTDSHMRIRFTSRQVWDALDVAYKGARAGALGNHTFLRTTDFAALSAPDEGPGLPGGPGTIHPLVQISNSETGDGGLSVSVGLLQAICVNGAIVQRELGAVHLGGKLGIGQYSDETRSAESKAIALKARDVVGNAFKPDVFRSLVAQARVAQATPVIAPSAALDNVVKIGLPESAKDSVLTYFLGDYDRSAWGLSQAVARFAQDTPDAEAAEQIETIAGQLIVNPQLAVA